jgi:uncharacterized peroxidase-related enzyme
MAAWIRTLDLDDADETLRSVYDRVVSTRGRLSDIMRVQSLAPVVMAAHLDLYMAIMFGRSPLSRRDREALACVVSAANGCAYCAAHHRAALLAHWRDAGAVDRFIADPLDAAPDARLRALAAYALKLTRSVHDMSEDEVSELRGAGLDDEAILHTAFVIAYFNFVNRLAEGLGVAPRPDEVGGYRY